jgi:hypothetical protein
LRGARHAFLDAALLGQIDQGLGRHALELGQGRRRVGR